MPAALGLRARPSAPGSSGTCCSSSGRDRPGLLAIGCGLDAVQRAIGSVNELPVCPSFMLCVERHAGERPVHVELPFVDLAVAVGVFFDPSELTVLEVLPARHPTVVSGRSFDMLEHGGARTARPFLS